jgi:(p)ppGpp synthase/HD superfamily hydrolase
MNEYLRFGRIVLDVSTIVKASDRQEALQKIHEMINELNANISNVPIKTIDGKVHNLEVHNFHIEWEDDTE